MRFFPPLYSIIFRFDETERTSVMPNFCMACGQGSMIAHCKRRRFGCCKHFDLGKFHERCWRWCVPWGMKDSKFTPGLVMYSCLWIPTPMWERLTRTLLWCQFPFFHLLFKSCSTAHPHTYRRHKLNVFVGGSCSIRWCQCTSGGLCPRLTRSLNFIRCSQGSSSLCGRGANADCTWQEAELSRLEVWHVFFSQNRDAFAMHRVQIAHVRQASHFKARFTHHRRERCWQDRGLWGKHTHNLLSHSALVEVLAPATSPDADWLDPDVFFFWNFRSCWKI